MKLELLPLESSSNSLISKLLVDGENECFILERPWNLGDNAHEVSAILGGTFEIVMSFSPHWKKDMPHLKDVPGRTDIMIHPANWPQQLKGCLAPGRTRSPDKVGVSDEAYKRLLKKMQATWQEGGKVWIKINRPDGTAQTAAGPTDPS